MEALGMKISTKGRYALRMMIDIAENSGDERVTIKEISERQNISVKYLEQIVPNLTKTGLLRSERGSGGGYRLSKAPDQYTMGDILRAIEGKLAPVACLEDEINQCSRAEICKTLRFWKGLYKVINDYVDSITLQDVIISGNGENGLNYSI
jgi:Rrf2 family protein